MAQLHIKNLTTGEVVKSIEVTDPSATKVERIVRGLLINMHEDYVVDDSEFDYLYTETKEVNNAN